MALRLYSYTPKNPVSLDRVKSQLRILDKEDDAELMNMIQEASDYVERRTRQILTKTEYQYLSDCFIDEFELPISPVISIDSITYLDTTGTMQTLPVEDYQVDVYSSPARIRPAYGKSWPATKPDYNAVKVTLTAGFDDESDADADKTPESIKRALLLLISHWYENREAVVVGTINSKLEFSIDSLLAPFQRY